MGRRFVFIMANHLVQPLRIRTWLADAAPWYGDDEADKLIQRVERSRTYWGPDTLASAKWLNISYAVRKALDLRTIGAFDMSKAERKRLWREGYRDRKRELDRAWRERQRRKRGITPRAAWEAAHNTNRTKPWEAAGVSRRTWYRNRGTGPSCAYIFPNGDSRHTCVTPRKPRRPKLVTLPKAPSKWFRLLKLGVAVRRISSRRRSKPRPRTSHIKDIPGLRRAALRRLRPQG
jgi:hypothetical protein